jgi:hypothetical protein
MEAAPAAALDSGVENLITNSKEDFVGYARSRVARCVCCREEEAHRRTHLPFAARLHDIKIVTHFGDGAVG